MRALRTIVCLAVVLAAPLAQAQPDELTQLRRDVAQLREQLAVQQQRVRALEAERDKLRDELAKAREEIDALRHGGTVPAPGEPPTTTKTAPVPDDPFAAPEAMYAELVRRYTKDFADLPASVDRDALVEELEQWARLTARDLRQRTTWLVTIADLKPIDRSRTSCLMTVLDEASGLPIGKPFRVTISRSNAERIKRMDDRYDRWRATVIFQAMPTINPQRSDVGVFDTPRLVGPYAEFGYSVVVKSIMGEKNPPARAPDASRDRSKSGR